MRRIQKKRIFCVTLSKKVDAGDVPMWRPRIFSEIFEKECRTKLECNFGLVGEYKKNKLSLELVISLT